MDGIGTIWSTEAIPWNLILRITISKPSKGRKMKANVLLWFKNDLRLHDNETLQRASYFESKLIDYDVASNWMKWHMLTKKVVPKPCFMKTAKGGNRIFKMMVTNYIFKLFRVSNVSCRNSLVPSLASSDSRLYFQRY